jgi:hypothetical protein
VIELRGDEAYTRRTCDSAGIGAVTSIGTGIVTGRAYLLTSRSMRQAIMRGMQAYGSAALA